MTAKEARILTDDALAKGCEKARDTEVYEHIIDFIKGESIEGYGSLMIPFDTDMFVIEALKLDGFEIVKTEQFESLTISW